MATKSTAQAHWEGSLMEGAGQVELATSGVGTFELKWAKRAEASAGATNPEELIAAAHASCYSMALSNGLAQHGTPPDELTTSAAVAFEPGVGITGSHLSVTAVVPGLSAEDFQRLAEDAKANCPVSKALAGVDITLDAALS